MIKGRALHFVFKIGDRKATAKFYRDVLGMKVLRHEEFSEGCEAFCNGPYANSWSKTMIGYGPEDTHFVMELTYNYGVGSYQRGNDFRGVYIKSSETLARAKQHDWPIHKDSDSNVKYLEAPGGYRFYVLDEPQPKDTDPVIKVSLACSDLTKTIDYWHKVLGLKLYDQKAASSALVGFADDQAKVEFVKSATPVDRAQAYGRIAFSCPYEQQPVVDKKVQEAKGTILTPLLTLPTPGKATVRVIILADPDGHEICFVEDEGYRQLSAYDPESDAALDKSIADDKSFDSKWAKKN